MPLRPVGVYHDMLAYRYDSPPSFDYPCLLPTYSPCTACPCLKEVNLYSSTRCKKSRPVIATSEHQLTALSLHPLSTKRHEGRAETCRTEQITDRGCVSTTATAPRKRDTRGRTKSREAGKNVPVAVRASHARCAFIRPRQWGPRWGNGEEGDLLVHLKGA